MYDRAVEIDEAIAAGHRALDALAEAADSLDSAKRWGIVDILGGGFVTSMVKHSRLGTPTASSRPPARRSAPSPGRSPTCATFTC